MEILEAENVNDVMVKYLDLLLKKPKRQEILLTVKDARLTCAVAAPCVVYDLPVEIREVSDILTGPSIPEGHRYRYDRDLHYHYKPNAKIDWQYTHIPQSEIEALRKDFANRPSTDRCILGFWYGPRDTVEVHTRQKSQKTKANKPRSPCGLVWHYRTCRGGFHCNTFSRSIWYNTSLHADLLLPLEVGRHITGKKPREFETLVLNSKFKFTHNDDIEDMKRCLDWLRFNDRHMKIMDTFEPYDVWTEGEFEQKEIIEANARVGDYSAAYDGLAVMDSKIGRDWALSMIASEIILQKYIKKEMLLKWGIEPSHREITIAKNNDPWEGDPLLPVFECSKKGQFPYLKCMTLMTHFNNEFDNKNIDRIMERYEKPVQRQFLMYTVKFGNKQVDERYNFWSKHCKRYGVKKSLTLR